MKGGTMYLFIIFTVTIILPLILIPANMRNDRVSPFRAVFNAAVSVCVAAAVILMFSSLAEQGMFAQIKQVISDVSSQVAVNPVWDMVPQMDKLSTAEKAELFKQAYEALAIRIPAYIMTFATIVAYVEYIIVSNMPWNRSKVKHMPAFMDFSLPGNAFMGIFLMYFAAWGISMSGSTFGTAVYANVNFIFDFAFILQGISVVFMFSYIKRIPKIAAVIVIVIALCSNICRMLLVLLGMFDLITGIKNRMTLGPVKRK